MDFYNDKKNVCKYIDMVKDYDGEDYLKNLRKHLKKGSSLLELGMGPGKDLDILKKDYLVTGSDFSQIFLDIYRENHKNSNVELIQVDAKNIKLDKKFDCIYSNKVLQHLSKEELKISLKEQAKFLNTNGILFHSLWKGEAYEEFDGLSFVYYTEKSIFELIDKNLEILEIKVYSEMEDNDSLYIVLKKTY